MSSNITQGRRTQHCITQGVQGYVTIGMGRQTLAVINTHTTQHHVVAFTETVDINTLSNAEIHKRSG
jgi:hypothetical protein